MRIPFLPPKWAQDDLWTKARKVPSLDLRFADNKSLVDATTGAQLVTFTRASSGTFVGSDGLIQRAVTNLLLRSEEFDDAYWGVVDGTVSANSAIAPSGASTADVLTENSGTVDVRFPRTFTFIAGNSYTLSVYAKVKPGSSQRYLMLVSNSGFGTPVGVNFDLVAGSVGTTASATGAIQPLGDGWYRCSMTPTITATGSGAIRIRLAAVNTTANIQNPATYTGDGTSGLFIWGAQLEQSSTVGEYVPTTSTINSAPRFDHNPTTGESLGLLVEEQRTNLLVQSNGFDTTWTNTASTETAAQGIAPDGTNTAWALTDDTSNTNHNIFQSVSFSAVATTFSIYAKYSTHRWIGVRLGATGNQFFGSWDLQNGVVGSATAGATIGIQSVGNGWYRLTLTATLTSAGTANFIIGLNNADAVALTSYVGTGTTAFIWGAQLEVGAFPTSYIPTTTATVTRSADVASISGSNFSAWYRQDEGSLYVENKRDRTTGFPARIVIDDGTSTNRINSFYDAAVNSNTFAVTSANTLEMQIFYGGDPLGQFVKNSFGFATNNYGVFRNGLLVGSDSSVSMPVVNVMNIGPGLTGHFRRLTYWPQRLPNSTLQAVTQ